MSFDKNYQRGEAEADNTTIPRDGIPNLTYNTTSNRITTAGFEYDAAGNQTRAQAEDGTWLRYEYDAANRLQVIKRDDGTYLQAFQFGSTNARLMDMDYQYGYVKMIASIGGTTLAEYTEFAQAVMTWTKSYTYLGDSQLSTISKAGSAESVEYNHPDRLGTRVITNQAAGTSYEQTTLPFGTALNAESTVQNNSKRFTSYERSARTGLDYAINRTYDSKLGRFTQVDPIGMRAVSLSAPQTLNLYTYCGNDPINHTDPFGLFFGKLFKWLSKAFKWIAIAVTVAVIVLSIFVAPGSQGALAQILGILLKINKFIGAIGFSAEGAISVGFGAYISAGLRAVGAVASWFDRRQTDEAAKKRAAALEAAKQIVIARLKKYSKCAEAFGGAAKAIEALNKANIVFEDLGDPVSVNGKPNGPIKVVKAATDRSNNTIYINTKGGFGDRGYVNVNVDGRRTVVRGTSPGNGDGNDAEVIFHELGHLLNIYGKNDEDAGDLKKQKKNNKKIKDCL